jgi:hypothetical protein
VSSDLPNYAELQDRLLRLETQHRRFKGTVAIAAIVLTSIVVMGQAPTQKTVEANQFILRDDNGGIRARLSMNEQRSGPEMVLLDESGKPRLALETAPFGGIVRVFDRQGGLRLLLSPGITGQVGGQISLLDLQGHPKTTLAPGEVWVDGGIRLEDEQGYAAWLGRTGLLSEGETRTRSAASIALVDNNKRKVIWQAP